jgi:hypothetical protein
MQTQTLTELINLCMENSLRIVSRGENYSPIRALEIYLNRMLFFFVLDNCWFEENGLFVLGNFNNWVGRAFKFIKVRCNYFLSDTHLIDTIHERVKCN